MGSGGSGGVKEGEVEREKQAREEAGSERGRRGRELSNRIKGEQRNGEHLKYSCHEPSREKRKAGMSNVG